MVEFYSIKPLPKVLCVAYDAAPSRAFMKMREYNNANKDTFRITTMIADGKPDAVNAKEVADYIRDWEPNLILIGMSSQARDIEMCAIHTATHRRIPYGFYGDIPRAFTRPHFQEVLRGATFYMGTTPTEKEQGFAEIEAQGHCQFFATGNPLRDDFVIPDLQKRREEMRKEMKFGDRDEVILMPGNKEVVANIARVREFCGWLPVWDNPFPVRVMFAPHPGDKAFYAVDKRDKQELNIYDTLMKYQTKQGVHGSVLTERSASSILPVVDFVVDCGSSLAIEAMYNRIPSITWMTDEDRKNLISSNGHAGLEVLDNKCSMPGKLSTWKSLTSPATEKLTLESRLSLYGIYQRDYLHRVTETYPIPEIPDPYASVKKMLQVITDHLVTIPYLSH